MRRRKICVEGVFAHLDQLGFRRARRRGLDRVQVEGLIVAFTHNVLKATSLAMGPRSGAASDRSGIDSLSLGTWIPPWGRLT